MRTTGTLQRNVEMAFAVEMGQSLHEVARVYKIKASSVRSSVERTRSHLAKFVQTFPDTLAGPDARRRAYKEFAEHVGVKVKLPKKTAAMPLDLFEQ